MGVYLDAVGSFDDDDYDDPVYVYGIIMQPVMFLDELCRYICLCDSLWLQTLPFRIQKGNDGDGVPRCWRMDSGNTL